MEPLSSGRGPPLPEDEGDQQEEERDRHQERPERAVVVPGLEDQVHRRQEKAEERHRPEQVAVRNVFRAHRPDVKEAEIETAPRPASPVAILPAETWGWRSQTT